MTFRSGLPRLHSSIYLIPLWLSTFKRPLRFGRGRKAGKRATPFIPAGRLRNSPQELVFSRGWARRWAPSGPG